MVRPGSPPFHCLWVFKGHSWLTGRPRRARRSTRTPPPSPRDAIPVLMSGYIEKITLPGTTTAVPRDIRVAASGPIRVRESGSRFPFATPPTRAFAPWTRFVAAASGSGSTNSRARAVLEKPFSASVLRVLAWVRLLLPPRSAPRAALPPLTDPISPRPACSTYSTMPPLAPSVGFEDHAQRHQFSGPIR